MKLKACKLVTGYFFVIFSVFCMIKVEIDLIFIISSNTRILSQGEGISQQEEGTLMKPSKILLAGIVLVLAFGLAGCGTVQKKEEMKAPAAVAVKAGSVEMTA